MSVKTYSKGFTLIELVSVLVLLGIVAVSVVPRFSSREDVADYALRDELIASFRLAQQRATYDHSGACYRLNITASGFEPQKDGASFGAAGTVSFSGDYNGLSVSPAGPLYFDGLGNVSQASCGGAPLAATLPLTIGNTGVSVYSTGFIRAN